MKKFVSMFLILMLMVTAVGCADKGSTEEYPDETGVKTVDKSDDTLTEESDDTSEEGEVQFLKTAVTLSVESDERLKVETDAATAVNQYIVARCYLDKFLQYDIASGNLDEYNALLADTVAAFEKVESTAAALEKTAGALEDKESDDSYMGTDGSGSYNEVSKAERSIPFSLNPFEVVAYADEDESEAVKWAKDLTERFDKAPAGKGIRTLAEQMGTDAKHAYAQLRQAQDILAGASYEDFAETADAAYKTAKVLKTAGTAAQLTLSVMTADPATTLDLVMAGGGVVVNGLNTIFEVGQTGSILIVGDDNKLSQSLENYENSIAPIGQIIGAYGLAGNLAKGAELLDDVPAMADSVMYIGSSLYDYMSEGKILGGTFTQDSTGKINCTMCETMNFKTAWAKPEQAKEEVLEAVGFTPSEIEEVMEQTSSETVATVATDEIPMEMVEEVLSQTTDMTSSATNETMDDDDLDTGDESDEDVIDEDSDDESDENSDTEDADAEGTGAPSIDEIAGYYLFYLHMTLGDQSAEGEVPQTVKVTGGNNVSMTDDYGYTINGAYDSATGVAVFYDSDGTPVKVTFTKNNGKIHADLKENGDGFSASGSANKQ